MVLLVLVLVLVHDAMLMVRMIHMVLGIRVVKK